MTAALWILGLILAASCLFSAWLLLALAWMAKGDDSFNGVKDRDGGAR